MGSDCGSRIVDLAVSRLGTKYQKDGRGVSGQGLDCANFIGVVLLDLGAVCAIPEIQTPDRFWSDPFFSIENSIARVMTYGLRPYSIDPIDVADVRPGDFLGVTRFRKLDKITHMVVVERVLPYGTDIIEAIQVFGVRRSRLCSSMRKLAAFRVTRHG